VRRSGFDGPIALMLAAIAGSIAVNPARATAYEPIVLKGLTLFLSFVLIFYFAVSVLRSREAVDAVVKTLVIGGSVLALLAVVEARTGLTPFVGLDRVLPFLRPDPSFDAIIRGSTTRATGSAEHPIALGVAFALLIPLAVYIVRAAGPRWLTALGALALGVVATGSRTAVVMLAVIGLVFLWLRPRETRRLWPLLIPLLVVTHFAVPGALGSLKHAFLPEGGLIAQQSDTTGGCDAAGRVADLGPTLQEVVKKPFLGHGFGTRITTGPEANACILDNQWLGTAFEVGLAGLFAWLWLFFLVARRLSRAAAADDSPVGWLAVAVTASVTAYAVGMFTFDALGFTQVTFLLFVVLALGASAARLTQLRPS
jgi:polysaccharide biosynthesis protein PslJ